MSSSAHIDNKKKNILVLRIGPTQGLEHTLTAEKIYSINFTIRNKIFAFYKVCITMEQIVTYLLMVQKFTNLKQNISKDWSVDDRKRTGFTGYVMILVLIMMLLMLMILKIFISF